MTTMPFGAARTYFARGALRVPAVCWFTLLLLIVVVVFRCLNVVTDLVPPTAKLAVPRQVWAGCQNPKFIPWDSVTSPFYNLGRPTARLLCEQQLPEQEDWCTKHVTRLVGNRTPHPQLRAAG